MFDDVGRRRRGRNASRRTVYVVGSTALQVLVVLAIAAPNHPMPVEPEHEVIVQPPPMARSPAPVPRRKPTTDAPRPAPLPTAFVQPRNVPDEMTLDPGEPERVDPGPGPDGGQGIKEGQPTLDEPPAHASQGYVRPRLADPTCVQRAVRLPRDLQGFVSGPITVRFAVLADGSVARFAVDASHQVPDRVLAVIRQAVHDCRWLPGSDPQGRPTSIWVILPFRFRG
ncbi:MAG TPA: hypothetical protein VLS93_15000 [Anaeromyxobacteraceae bacterium]|nr:hypothetical protein [Anaeromyxobacteraceae bacterium]